MFWTFNALGAFDRPPMPCTRNLQVFSGYVTGAGNVFLLARILRIEFRRLDCDNAAVIAAA
jgi:hypothetical protein